MKPISSFFKNEKLPFYQLLLLFNKSVQTSPICSVVQNLCASVTEIDLSKISSFKFGNSFYYGYDERTNPETAGRTAIKQYLAS